MIKHGRDPGNGANSERFLRLRLSRRRYRLDGVKNLDTEIVQTSFYKTHVRLKIQTYKTAMQAELEKMNKQGEKNKLPVSISSGNDTLVAIGPGIAVQAPGTVIKMPPP